MNVFSMSSTVGQNFSYKEERPKTRNGLTLGWKNIKLSKDLSTLFYIYECSRMICETLIFLVRYETNQEFLIGVHRIPLVRNISNSTVIFVIDINRNHKYFLVKLVADI